MEDRDGMLLRDLDDATVLGKVLEVLGVQGGERQSGCQAVGHDPGVIDGPGPPPGAAAADSSCEAMHVTAQPNRKHLHLISCPTRS